jgi:hypothetical protein
MSVEFSEQIRLKFSKSEVCALQFRFGGVKGMLVVKKGLDDQFLNRVENYSGCL